MDQAAAADSSFQSMKLGITVMELVQIQSNHVLHNASGRERFFDMGLSIFSNYILVSIKVRKMQAHFKFLYEIT